eukprot:CAMPEP_0185263392 /NCGR_PEP_ID=MMETSP1359-20130426/14919_1 /TAXON_ID=552665 /ORGANISM="Bigelowiella longifila, Strain CCMP242" /LENGTH=244 /DNA_ID=CAMNT_0027850909 /DNA_START=177 /DNA_END=911 /DNA_ORIENTATION=-
MSGMLVHSVRNEGLLSLYRGLHAPIISSGITSGASMFCKKVWTRVLRRQAGYSTSDKVPYSLTTISGALTGITIAPIMLPFDLVKIRMQGRSLQGGNRQKLTTLQCALRIAQAEGIMALASGSTVGVLQLTTMWAVVFGGYEYLMDKLTSHEISCDEGLASITAGSIVGVLSWASSMPFDIVKTKMQMDPEKNNSSIKVFRDIFSRDGIFGFYRGFTTVASRAVVCNASFFWAYEALSGALAVY